MQTDSHRSRYGTRAFTVWSGSTAPAYSLPSPPDSNTRQLTALGTCFVLSCFCILVCNVPMPITFPPWFFYSKKPSLKAQLKCHIDKRPFLTSNIPKQLVFSLLCDPSLPAIRSQNCHVSTSSQIYHDPTKQGYVLLTVVFTRPSVLVPQTFTNPSFVLPVTSCT